MSSDNKSSRVVFVGNIPYGLTEEEIVHIFSKVGTVVSFRLVYDRDTGKPKGFGFAEYADADSAASAVRNLNDYDTMNRKLRVDYSNDGGETDAAPAGYVAQPPPPPPSQIQPQHQQQSINGAGTFGGVPMQQQYSNGGGNDGNGAFSMLPPLPPGVELPANITCPDAISRTLSTLPAPQLLDILTQMKGLVMVDPAKATELLKQAPQLAYAVFQALLLMGLVDASALQSVIEQAAAPAATQQQQYPSTLTPQPQAQAYIAPPSVPVPQSHTPQSQPQQQVPPQPAPAAAPAAPAAAGAPQIEKAALIQQVMGLTEAQLNAMPAHERDQIRAVQQQIRTGALRL
ncbi:MAG: hypothetical protein M1825_005846 [Sarcosagium campestre]|nr:MAG: hypothetical protein M1825_005846 [Sarcosagium campestre]